ncbi:MAG: Eco57I restriction-modification methylase domain-containing protein [Bacteroidales bacterium]|nr:Eco57I restriction-modification methylase domain-containing protein [Bacteroidales bacterium]
MIITKKIKIYNNLSIEFEGLKDTFLPKLKDFATQKSILKQQSSKNEKAFESELKSLLKNTFYKETYIGNRPYKKGEADLIIAESKNATSKTSVLIEVKSPLDKNDFITKTDLNRKSFFQAVTYFLTEIVEKQNFNIKNILITDTEDFYLFDAVEFHKLFYKSSLRQNFDNWYFKTQSGTSITDFYQQVENYINSEEQLEIEFSHFQLTDDLIVEIDKALQTNEIEEFNKENKFRNIKNAFRFFSPQNLQKEKSEKDGSELNKKFYNELLYILGLKEYEKNGNNIIDRLPKKDRNEGSFIENTIEKIIFERPIHLQEQGEKRFVEQAGDLDIALELCIIWINRILFLKLLEGQLESYHNDTKNFHFLTPEIIKNGNKLATLFFHVLNTPNDNRSKSLQSDFKNIPYLNSSLFQITYLETIHGRISGLRDDLTMPIYKNSVLDISNDLPPLEYLLLFLDAYNFGEPIKQDVQHKTKDLINASVLGKIFEKLNGYKDGSFYTPSYITMYMSRKVVRNAIIRKFNEKFELNASNFDEIKQFTKSKYKTEDIENFNQTVNEITVCDPAVGSGHFLVSVLNELICAKSELEILYDNKNQPLQYWISVENDELKIFNKRIANQEFEYKTEYKNGIRTVNPELQKIQTTLFREKQNFIENSLYGVDINPNSVQICRLRLWIELLKNSYYTADSNFQLMETLPNLDYKIIEGNSLLPVYENQPIIIDWTRKNIANSIKSISNKVEIINNSINTIKEKKHEIFYVKDYNKKISLTSEINRAKADLLIAKFEIEIVQINEILSGLNPEQRLGKQLNKKEEKQRNELLEKKAFLQKIKREIDYSPDLGKPIVLFDWNIDFAEIIGTFQNGNGDNTGFDIVIGNPPYIQHRELGYISPFLKSIYHKTYSGTADISVYFFEKGMEITKKGGQLAYINTNKFFNTEYGKELRSFLAKYQNNEYINFEQVPVFDEALVSTSIFHIDKQEPKTDLKYAEFYKELVTSEIFEKELLKRIKIYPKDYLKNPAWLFTSQTEDKILEKIKKAGKRLGEIATINIKRGVTTGFDDAFIIDEQIFNKLSKTAKNKKALNPLLRGKDIHKFDYYHEKFWLIFTRRGVDIKEMPQIERFLKKFYAQLKPRETGNEKIGRKPGKYKWYEIQDNIAYYLDFDKEKMIWGIISGIWGFAYDDKKHFLTSASFLLTSEKIPIKFLLALFNSRLFQFYFDKTGEYTAGGAYVLKKKNVEKFIIPTKKMDYEPYIELVDKILLSKKKNKETSELEDNLNKKVYQLYDITEAEQEEIETILIKGKIK